MTEVTIRLLDKTELDFHIGYEDNNNGLTKFDISVNGAWVKQTISPSYKTRETVKRIIQKLINEYRFDMESITIKGGIY